MPEHGLNSTPIGPVLGEDQGLATWKSAVEKFFSGEWDNLRELIRQIEETDWEDTILAPPERSTRPQPEPFHAAVAQHLQASPVTPAVDPPADSNRLADLAKRLEARLKQKGQNV